ncbi:MAG: rhombotarget lipoprotein [Thermodesulfobacteriota bacterium]|nr:rhombotarget lipoprotein [Thermodesulfobacteriota bacterium]
MRKQLLRFLGFGLALVLVAGCTNLWHDLVEVSTGREGVRKGVSSSLVDYLYPKGEVPPEHDQSVPNLNLPLRVGLAFVPARSTHVEGLSEAHKTELLERVKEAFEGRGFIKEIFIVPDTYMRSGRGFEGVDQIARLYGLDIMALVSYDQVAHADDTKASILYWTIVGAYFVKGSKNDVQTFVDTAIFDVKTHKLLFRAPGVNTIEATSTLVNSSEEMRKAREGSFALAMGDMTENLDKELDLFKSRIEKDKTVTLSYGAGYTGGGGAFGYEGMVVLFVCLLAKVGLSRRKRE